jgi:hypothetical protein
MCYNLYQGRANNMCYYLYHGRENNISMRL